MRSGDVFVMCIAIATFVAWRGLCTWMVARSMLRTPVTFARATVVEVVVTIVVLTTWVTKIPWLILAALLAVPLIVYSFAFFRNKDTSDVGIGRAVSLTLISGLLSAVGGTVLLVGLAGYGGLTGGGK